MTDERKTFELRWGRGAAAVFYPLHDFGLSGHPLAGPPIKPRVVVRCGRRSMVLTGIPDLRKAAGLCRRPVLAVAREDALGMASLISEMEGIGRVVVDSMRYRCLTEGTKVVISENLPRLENEMLRFLTFVPHFDPFPHFLGIAVNLDTLDWSKERVSEIARQEVDPSDIP